MMIRTICLVIVAAVLCCSQAVAQGQSESLALLQNEEDAFQAAVNRVQDSVVQIETFGGLQVVDSATVAEGPSTGTVVGADGWIVTSQFQFRNDPASITVVLADGSRKAARVVARDYSRELVLLKIEVDRPLPVPQPAERAKLKVGQWAIALGKTFDTAIASRSVGIVSAIYRIWNKAVQADAKISPMNYGGPLIDIHGRVIGIIAPIDPGIATEGEVQQWYDSGVGFVIPFEDILSRLTTLQSGKDIRSGLLGFRPESRDDFKKEAVIAGVVPGSPLARAGLQKGDRIVSINSEPVKFVNHLRHLLGPIDAGQSITIEVQRQGQTITKTCELVSELPKYSAPFIGLIPRVVPESKQLSVAAVEPGGPADKAGIKPGDVIQRVSGETVNTLEQFNSRFDFSDYRQPITVEVMPRDATEPKSIEVKLTRWPDSEELEPPKLAELQLKGDSAAKNADEKFGLTELPFADVPNKIFAYVPKEAAGIPLGLYIVAAEPGDPLDRQKVVDAWQDFCREQAFAICVISSADPKAWNREELEVVNRAKTYMSENYTLDDRLLVIGGFGAGNTIAMATAFEAQDEYRALVFNSERTPRRLKPPAVEPQMGLDILLGPENEQSTAFKDSLIKEGYRVESLGSDFKLDESPDSALSKHLRNYLATLRWY